MPNAVVKKSLCGLLVLCLAAPLAALADGPGGPGGPGHGGPGYDAGRGHGHPTAGPGPGPGWRPGGGFTYYGPGPRRGHGLPDFAREVWIGSSLFFLAAGTYYLWNATQERYVVVQPPPAVQSVATSSYDVIAYPARGQPVDVQERDRYECHRWAVSQSGFDPASSVATGGSAPDYYRRALGACLTGRGYSIN